MTVLLFYSFGNSTIGWANTGLVICYKIDIRLRIKVNFPT